MKKILIACGLSLIALPAAWVVQAQQKPTSPQSAKIDPAIVERYVSGTWKSSNDEWKARVTQDETQRICTAEDNAPVGAAYDVILAREKATVEYPADGDVIGDWKKGEQVAQRGTGGQFSDTAATLRGGNCYACHQMAPAELSYGTLGPTLTNYGKDRKFDKDEAKATYAKIYNAMSVAPCSQMPRFGFHKFLTQDQIKDAVAFLFDPASPVNK
jgi:L-cysteine S-thiosulfotransferase